MGASGLKIPNAVRILKSVGNIGASLIILHCFFFFCFFSNFRASSALAPELVKRIKSNASSKKRRSDEATSGISGASQEKKFRADVNEEMK